MIIFGYFIFIISAAAFFLFLPVFNILLAKKILIQPNLTMAAQDRVPASALHFFENINDDLIKNDFEKLIDVFDNAQSIYVRFFVNRSIGDTASAVCYLKQNNIFYSYIEFRTKISRNEMCSDIKYSQVISTNYKNGKILISESEKKIINKPEIEEPENLYIFHRKQVLTLLLNKKGTIPPVSDEIKRIVQLHSKELEYIKECGFLYLDKNLKYYRYTFNGAFTFIFKSTIFRKKAFEGA